MCHRSSQVEGPGRTIVPRFQQLISNPLVALLLSTPSRVGTPWRPKLTPYRLLTFLTTVVLGSVKAYAVSQNLLFVATSIERRDILNIRSMYLRDFLILYLPPNYSLFVLGLCESEPPRLLKWLMTPDLVHLVFRTSRYRIDELKRPVYAHQYYGLTGFSDGVPSPHEHDGCLVRDRQGLFRVSGRSRCQQFARLDMRDCHDALVSKDEYWSHPCCPRDGIFFCRLYILGLYENNPVHLIYVIKTLSVAFAFLGASVASVASIRMSLVYLFNFFFYSEIGMYLW